MDYPTAWKGVGSTCLRFFLTLKQGKLANHPFGSFQWEQKCNLACFFAKIPIGALTAQNAQMISGSRCWFGTISARPLWILRRGFFFGQKQFFAFQQNTLNKSNHIQHIFRRLLDMKISIYTIFFTKGTVWSLIKVEILLSSGENEKNDAPFLCIHLVFRRIWEDAQFRVPMPSQKFPEIKNWYQ